MATHLPGPQPATRWQLVCLVLGLLLFATLIQSVGLGAVPRAFQRKGRLTPPIVIPVDILTALSIDALSGVAKLSAVIVPGSLGIQEGGQILIFLGFGLGAPVALTFGLLRRGRELLWIGFGLVALIRHQARGWLRGRRGAGPARQV